MWLTAEAVVLSFSRVSIYSALLKTQLDRTLPLMVEVLLQSIYGHHRIGNVPPSTTFHRPVSSLTDYGVAAHFLSIPPHPQEASFLHVVRKWLARRHMNKTSDGPNVCRFNFTSSSTPGHIHDDVLNIYFTEIRYIGYVQAKHQRPNTRPPPTPQLWPPTSDWSICGCVSVCFPGQVT